MYNASSSFRVSSFRKQPIVWMMLTVFCLSFAPSVSIAQQPSATIRSLTGTVLVNGQQQGEGTVLLEKDIIRTEAGASVVLELSDGSQLELGENTRVEMQELAQTATGARTSLVKMLYGRIRATLSLGHQQEGSSFNIETPNALVGVKFSQPDVEVQYDADTEETTAFAITVALLITNLLTGEEQLVPIGSTAIITALGIQVISGLSGLGTTAAESAVAASTGGGIGTGTMIAIGAGALVAAGGIAAAVVAGSSDDDGDGENLEPTGQCNEKEEAGEDIPGTFVIELGKRSGTFRFEYETYSQRDQMVVEYEGVVLFDTGCVGANGARDISYSGRSSKVTIRVFPNCAGGSGTAWNFTVRCPF